MGEGVRGLMGTGRSRVEFEDCGVGRMNVDCAWHVFGVWGTQGLKGEAWKRVVCSLEKCTDLRAQPCPKCEEVVSGKYRSDLVGLS